MTTDELYIKRCFELAAKGICSAAPNPMVGSVIVHNGQIIGEGYHERYGCAHAEPNAIASVKNKELLKESTLYVNLEPCSHFGKTPPCASLIVQHQIPRVVICNIDPFPQVAGRGIKLMQEAGIDVSCGVLEKEGRELNKRFFTFHEKHRPYILLKWAQSEDGFMDSDRTDTSIPPAQFSTQDTQVLNHKIRTEEAAILVGTNTVLMDNPQLTSRLYDGRNPVRVLIDRKGIIGKEYRVLNNEAKTLVFTEKEHDSNQTTLYIRINFEENILSQILDELYKQNLNSLIVEGGARVLNSFIEQNLWDEAKVEIAPFSINKGVKAPELSKDFISEKQDWEPNKIIIYKNRL